jgi:mannose-6-phosphate isomerase-like protein (cupin superfamily)
MQDPLEGIIAIASISAALERPLEPQDVVTVNDAIVRIAAVLGETPWHQHPHDELFLCWEGRFRLDIDGHGPIHLGAGDLFVVPRGVEHRAVATERAVTLLVERPET